MRQRATDNYRRLANHVIGFRLGVWHPGNEYVPVWERALSEYCLVPKLPCADVALCQSSHVPMLPCANLAMCRCCLVTYCLVPKLPCDHSHATQALCQYCHATQALCQYCHATQALCQYCHSTLALCQCCHERDLQGHRILALCVFELNAGS